MCRILGIAGKQFSHPELQQHIAEMAKKLQHGGPDDEGFYIDDQSNLALGHRRLSLLDLTSSGHQPMLSINNSHAIVFNGEVYNFKEIREQLIIKNYQFKSSSDTEVLLYAFIEWGTESFSMFRGMFAFSIYDIKKQQLFLVRDAQGIKPLYYYYKNELLVFSSEVKAFNTLPIDFETNPDWPIAFLSLGHLPEPMTTLKDVFMLPKSHYATINLSSDNKNPSLDIISYQTQINVVASSANPQHQVDAALDKAIHRQLIADAPIGVFLSGGIDSSLLALQAAKYQKEKLTTISIHFPEAKFSEKNYQQLISDKLPGKHISKEITKKDFNRYFEEILDTMDQPTTDGINSWFVSKAAKEAGLKAVLSGIGADELFGGYPSFKRIKKIPFMRSFSYFIEYLAKKLKNDSIARVSYLRNSNNPVYEYLFLRGFFSSTQLTQLFSIKKEKQYQLLSRIKVPYNSIPKSYNGKRAAWFEQHYFMQNQLLKDADSMSMLHGVEIRIPFLDEELVHLADHFPDAILFDKNKPAKHLLINAFEGILPKEIWNRPKMGFTFPFQEWLKDHPLYIALKENHAHKEKKELFKNFESGKIHWSKIMSLLVLEKFAA